jgi:hypothetical protein
LPPGTDTDSVGDWQTWNGATIRLCWSDPTPLPGHLTRLDVRAVVQQQPDGSIADEPSVCVGQDEYSVSDARLVAQALIAAADAGQRMATREIEVAP